VYPPQGIPVIVVGQVRARSPVFCAVRSQQHRSLRATRVMSDHFRASP
jgi:hypothetical protein